MARTHKRVERSFFGRRLHYLLVVLSGGVGFGGWQFKDHPILQRVLQQVTGSDSHKPLAGGEVIRAAARALTDHESFRTAGTFDVKVSKVKLESGLLKAIHTPAIQIRVRKRDASGNESIVWDSKESQETSAEPAREGSSDAWSGGEFQVRWAPGDQIDVDIWDRTSLITTKHFEMKPGTEDGFPLRSGTHSLALEGLRLTSPDPDTNQIVFESHRVSSGRRSSDRGSSEPTRPAQPKPRRAAATTRSLSSNHVHRSAPVAIRVSIDRFEGDGKQIAVLLTDDDQVLNVPRAQLPKGAHAGDVLTLNFVRDAEATEQVAAETRKVQDELKARDPGGDLAL